MRAIENAILQANAGVPVDATGSALAGCAQEEVTSYGEYEGFHEAKTEAAAANVSCDPFAFTGSADSKMAKQGWVAATASLQPSEFSEARPDPSVVSAVRERERERVHASSGRERMRSGRQAGRQA